MVWTTRFCFQAGWLLSAKTMFSIAFGFGACLKGGLLGATSAGCLPACFAARYDGSRGTSKRPPPFSTTLRL